MWRDAEGLSQHVACNGAKKVLLTAPGKGRLENAAFGVNQNDIKPEDIDHLCCKLYNKRNYASIKSGSRQIWCPVGSHRNGSLIYHDQNLIDNFHSGDRRGRAASIEHGTDINWCRKAVSKAMPEMEGKLTGNAIRVPTPNVSMAVANLNLEKGTNKEELNEYLREMALSSTLSAQIDYTDSTEIVSADLVGSRHPGVVDGVATIAQDNRAVLYIWYDNEFGYSC